MPDLVLHVEKEYFEAIRDGGKAFEYRLVTPYWEKRLRGRTYGGIQIHCGYPKTGDTSRIIRRPWKGFAERIIRHPHFGDGPVRVFAIYL